jgi:hypothetical protein
MEQLVFREKRPFCYLDFLEFEVNGIKYNVAHGTFRNKISKLMKKGEVRLICYSPQAFYAVKGTNLLNRIPVWNTVADNNQSKIINEHELTYFRNKPIYRELKNLPFKDCGLHNLHLKFRCDGLWHLLCNDKKYVPVNRSEDILLVKLRSNNLIISATVHHTDTVTIVVKCSRNQIILDMNGIVRLDDALSSLEAQIHLTIDQSMNGGSFNYFITPYTEWIVTLWHFAIDCSAYYSGERFFCSWKLSKTILIAIYSKWWPDDKYRIRIERQECPKITLVNALDKKLRHVNRPQ